MTSQRPAWFRLSAMRPAAPAPAPAPARPPAPTPAVVRPAIPIRPPTQTQESAPPSAAVSLPPTAPSSPPAPAAAPPRSPVAGPAPAAAPPAPALDPAPPSSPVATATPTPAAAPPRSPVAPPPPPTPPVVLPDPLPSSPRAPAAAPSITAPPPRSPIVRPALQPSLPMAAAAPLPTRSAVVRPAPRPFLPRAPPITAPPPRSPVERPAAQPSSPRAPDVAPQIASPPPPKSPTPSSAKPTSPVRTTTVATTAPNGRVNGTAPTPVSSPKIVKPNSETSPAQSPKTKPLTHPPSPLTLPGAQIKSSEGERERKFEQKNVLVQESIEKPMKMHNAHNHGNSSRGKREVTMKDNGTIKKVSDSEEFGMRVITIAGENKGALMEISTSGKKSYGLGNPHTLPKTGEEGKSNNKEDTDKAMTMQPQPTTTFLNSNVQGVNNSIVFNSTSHHNDPGIHLSLIRKANGGLHKD